MEKARKLEKPTRKFSFTEKEDTADNVVVGDFLKERGAKKQDVKRTKVIEYAIPAVLKKKVSRYCEVVDAEKALKAQREVLKDEIVEGINPARLDAVKANGYHTSARIAGNDDREITVSYKDAYEKITLESEDTLRGIVGGAFDTFFEIKNDIKVKSTLTEDELKSLITIVGATKFDTYFEVTTTIKPTETYTKERHRFLKPEKLELLANFVKQIFAFKTK